MRLKNLRIHQNNSYIHTFTILLFLTLNCCKSNTSNKYLNENNSKSLSILSNNCGIIFGNKEVLIGQSIEEWKQVLGNRFKNKVLNFGLPLVSEEYNIFVWNELGISIFCTAQSEEDWKVNEVYIFLSIPSDRNKDLMLFEYMEEKMRLFYENNPNYIEDFAEINRPWVGEERQSNDIDFLEKLQKQNSNITKYIYPKIPFQDNITYKDVLVNKSLSIKEINNRSESKGLTLIGFDSKIFFPLDDESKMKSHLFNDEYKNDSIYLKTDTSIKGLYGFIMDSTTTRNIMVNNNNIEFINISNETCRLNSY